MAADERLLRKGAETSEPRVLTGRWARAAGLIALLWALFILYTGAHGPLPSLQNNAVFLTFGFAMTMLLYPATAHSPRYRPSALDLVLAAAGMAGCLWAAINWDRLASVMGQAVPADFVFSAILIALTLEATRRVMGPALALVTLAMVAYALLGNHIPGVFGHRGFDPADLLESLFFGTTGMWGTISSIIASAVATFVVFGSVLFYTGGGDTFKDLALYLAGRQTGGAGKVATVGSALFGMISGSASANAATVGNFTIAMMKRLGYRAELAAAIEAVASTGGQMMPPIMGAAAFVMAQIIQVPYVTIAVAAAVPAILYYLGCMATVHFEAKREGLEPVPAEMVPQARSFLTWGRAAPLFVPVVVMTALLLNGYSPATAGFTATGFAIVLFVFTDLHPAGIWQRVVKMLEALEQAGKGLVMLAVLGVSADIIVGLFGLTGLGVKVSGELIALSGGNLFTALVLTALVCTVLGMGVTTTADYVLASSVIGPALVNLGLTKLTAHMFIFYFAASSALTPPVCAAVFVTAGLANANWLKTAYKACILGIAAFLVPFAFAYSPSLLLDGPLQDIVINSVSAGLGIISLAAGIAGYFRHRLHLWQRVLLVVSGLALVWPSYLISALGLAGLAVAFLTNRTAAARIARGTAESPSALAPSK